MNIDNIVIPSSISEGIKDMNKSQIQQFFNDLRMAELNQIGVLSNEVLTQVQTRANLIKELGDYFILIHSSKLK